MHVWQYVKQIEMLILIHVMLIRGGDQSTGQELLATFHRLAHPIEARLAVH